MKLWLKPNTYDDTIYEHKLSEYAWGSTEIGLLQVMNSLTLKIDKITYIVKIIQISVPTRKDPTLKEVFDAENITIICEACLTGEAQTELESRLQRSKQWKELKNVVLAF